MAEYSQAVLQQKNSAEELIRAIQTHKARIFGKMAELLKPYMTQEQYQHFLSDAVGLFDAQIAHLENVSTQMADVDLEHARELLQTGQARTQRDLVLTDTYTQLNSLKQAILGFHGDSGLALLGMGEETPRVPIALERYLENVVNIVRNGVVMPPQLLPGPAVWGTDAVLVVVQPMYQRLRDALDEVSRELQEDKDTMTRKWELMEKQNYLYTAVANIAEAYARIVGDHDLGERLRPRPIGRPGRRATPEEGGEVIPPLPLTEPTPPTVTPPAPVPVE